MRDFSGLLVLVGAGKMGGALLEGWLRLGLDPKRVAVLEPQPSPQIAALAAPRLAAQSGSETLADVAAIVIAVKPQVAAQAVPALAPLISASTVVVSIMAGRTLQFLAGALARPVRDGARHAEYAGRDRPRHHRRGAAQRERGAARPRRPAARRDRRGRVDRRRSADGRGDRGVGLGAGLRLPARRSAGAGRRRRPGLPPPLAAKLARETVAGSGELLHRSPLDAAALRENVTSPGGTTAAALAVLMGRNGLAALMTKAVAAATARSRELAG